MNLWPTGYCCVVDRTCTWSQQSGRTDTFIVAARGRDWPSGWVDTYQYTRRSVKNKNLSISFKALIKSVFKPTPKGDLDLIRFGPANCSGFRD